MHLAEIYKREIGEAVNVDHILAIAACIKHDERKGRLTTIETMTLLMKIEKDKRVNVTGYNKKLTEVQNYST